MSDSNSINVTIFGGSYDIKGSEDRDYILKIANFVDEKMAGISQHYTQYSSVMMAVLAAVQMADELYKKDDVIEELKKEKEKLLTDFEHKISMSEESKNSYIEQKKMAEKYMENYKESQKELYEKYELLRDSEARNEQLEDAYAKLKTENETLAKKTSNMNSSSEDRDKELETLKLRNSEIENDFFDTQMENVQMKKQIEQLKKELESRIQGL